MKHKGLIQILLLIFFLTPVSVIAGVWTPMNSGTSQALWGIWGTSATDVFTVSWYGVILHYDGNEWSSMISGTTENLYYIWGSSGKDVFAVGYDGTILHYDGCDTPSCSIDGKVTQGRKVPLPGVTMTLSGDYAMTTSTDDDGNYSFSGLTNVNYIVTPSKGGYKFRPRRRSVNINGADVMNQNFRAVKTR